MGNFEPSTSPYANNFEAILDPGIKEVVLALNAKGYLTASSCEGHMPHKPRYINLCFGSEKARDEFNHKISNSWLGLLYPTTHIATLSQETIAGSIVKHTDLKDEILGLNHLFMRSFDQYCFLRLHIGATFYTKPSDTALKRHLNKVTTFSLNLCTRYLLTKYLVLKVKRMEHSHE